MTSAGEFLVRSANRRGVALWVDTDSRVVYYPPEKMNEGLLKIMNRHYYRVHQWLVAEGLCAGDENDH